MSVSCSTCDGCQDAVGKVQVTIGDKTLKWPCKRLAKKKFGYCDSVPEVSTACPISCDSCDSPPPSTSLSVGDSWTYDLSGQWDTYDTKVVMIDLFDTNVDKISTLKNEGIFVSCYFSAGSWEDWRDDKDDFPSSAIGKKLDGWAGERWVDVRKWQVRKVMKSRLELASSKGCDGVEPDNVDGWINDTGFPLSESDSVDFLKFLAKKAHDIGLLIGLKNSADSIEEFNLVSDFDFAIVEECYAWDECCKYEAFIADGKPVFSIEYTVLDQNVCDEFKSKSFSLIFGNYALTENWFCPNRRRAETTSVGLSRAWGSC